MRELRQLLSHSILHPSDNSITAHLKNGVSVHIYNGEKYDTSDGEKTRVFTEGFRYSAVNSTGRLIDFEVDKYVGEDRMIRILIGLGGECYE